MACLAQPPRCLVEAQCFVEGHRRVILKGFHDAFQFIKARAEFPHRPGHARHVRLHRIIRPFSSDVSVCIRDGKPRDGRIGHAVTQSEPDGIAKLKVRDPCHRTGISSVALDAGVPIANGILTTENDEQAEVRMMQKGADCAAAAVEMANLLRVLGKS